MKTSALALAAALASHLGCVAADAETSSACTESYVTFASSQRLRGDGEATTTTMTSTVMLDLQMLRDLQGGGDLDIGFTSGVLRFAPGQLATLQKIEATIVPVDGVGGSGTLIMSYVPSEADRRSDTIDLGTALDTETLLSTLRVGDARVTYTVTLSGPPWGPTQVQSSVCVSARLHVDKSL